MYRHQKAGQNNNIKIGNKSFENIADIISGKVNKKSNYIHEGTDSSLNSRNS
jgi:hypothetical protein